MERAAANSSTSNAGGTPGVHFSGRVQLEEPSTVDLIRPVEETMSRKTTESSLQKGVSEFFQDTVTTMLRRKTTLTPLIRSSKTSTKSLQDNLNDSAFADIARSDSFQYVTLLIIVLNAIWIGIDTEWNHDHKRDLDSDGVDDVDSYPLEPGSIVIENIFCVYFFVEVVIRFLAFKLKLSFWKDAWFVFDSVLVFFMVLETWVLKIIEAVLDGGSGNTGFASFSALRLMRLLRLTRLGSLMRQFPELMVLVKGIIASTKNVAWMLVFLLLIMYVFAILLTSIIAKPPPHSPELTPDDAGYLFGSLGSSLMTLFTQGVLGDNLADIVDVILSEGVLLMWVFWLFFGIASLTLLNMLIAVLCMVIETKANEERDVACDMELRRNLEEAFLLIDVNLDGVITTNEFNSIRHMPHLRESLAACGIDSSYMDDELQRLQDAIFAVGTEELSFTDFATKVLDLQPQRHASCLAMEILRSNQITKCNRLSSYMTAIEDGLRRLGEIQGSGQTHEEEQTSCLSHVPAHQLVRALKDRMCQVPHCLEDSSLSALPARTEESCFSDISCIPKVSSNRPQAGFAIEATEGDYHPLSLRVSPKMSARQHPLFKILSGRHFVHGWQVARDVARQLSKRPLPLLELSASVKTIPAAEIRQIIDAIPEMFEHRQDDVIALRRLEEHLQGCPNYVSRRPMSQIPCNCVSRLCDVLVNCPCELPSEHPALEERWPQPPEFLE